MITIQGDEIRKLCISDMHFTYRDLTNPDKDMTHIYNGFVDYARGSDAHMVINYGDTISSEYLWYLHSLSSSSLSANVDQAARDKYVQLLTERRLRRDSSKPDRFHSNSFLIQQFARASGHPHALSRSEIEQQLHEIRSHDRDLIDFIIQAQNTSNKPLFMLHGNHECITLSESEIAGLFNRASGHKHVKHTTHPYAFYQDVELVHDERDPIAVREVFFNSNIHNHATGGLSLGPHDLEWLQDTLSDADGRAVINMHIPLNFDQTPDEDPYSITRTYKESDTIRKAIAKAGNVALVASGHIHRIMFNQIDGVNYLTMPSFRHIPAFIDQDGRKGLKDPTGYFHELTLDFNTLTGQIERKRVIRNAGDSISIKSERKARHDFAPKSPLQFKL
ncbi:MAG: metallophosphoesterase [Alphaproteobacteria bacterium]|nr:metallophosphoesterase [Alphaproteobacteria bacterium]